MHLAAISFLLLNLLLTGCVAESTATPDLILFSGRSDKFVKPVINEFTRLFNIKVTIHNANSTSLLNKLQIEGEHTKADLFISNDAAILQKGSQLGLFQPLPEQTIMPIPQNFRSPKNDWVGLSARARVLVINPEKISENAIKSVFDLGNVSLKGKIGITHSVNESFISGVTVYMRLAGQDKVASWLRNLKFNAQGKVFNKHSKIVKAVASGKLDVGLVNHYYIYRHIDKYPNANIKIVIPDQGPDHMGVAWNVAGIAVSKYTQYRQLANKLVAFLVSKEGQTIFSEANREYPTRKDVKTSSKIPPRNSFKIADFPMYKLGKYRDQTIDLIEDVGMP